MAISTVVVLACLAGMTWWASAKSQERGFAGVHQKNGGQSGGFQCDNSEAIEKYFQRGGDHGSAGLREEEKEDQDEQIINAFQVLNDVTSPGDLDFTNPKLAILMAEMRSRWNYVRKREAELTELETHLTEQLQALHWHTNGLTRNRNELNQLFDGRVNLIRQEEEARLREMAKIYETLLLPDQPDGPAVIQQILRANISRSGAQWKSVPIHRPPIRR